MAPETPSGTTPTGRACAICGKPAVQRFKPFCSARCADIDLGRWLGEAYRIPAADDGSSGDGGGEDDGEQA